METFQKSLQKACEQLAKSDPVLKALINHYGPPTFQPHTNYYEELVSSIVSQQLSVKAAGTIWGRFIDLYSGTTPTPEQILQTDTEAIRKVGVSYAKIKYIKDLAEHVRNGALDLDHIATLPNQVVVDQLVAVKGIGEWSAHMFMIFCLGRLDILPWGDLGVRKSAQTLYGLPDLPNKDELIAVAETNTWAPYESVAAWYLWKSLDNKT